MTRGIYAHAVVLDENEAAACCGCDQSEGGGQDPADREHAGQSQRDDHRRWHGVHVPQSAQPHGGMKQPTHLSGASRLCVTGP